MRMEELFRNLGHVAGTVGAQFRQLGVQGVALGDLDLTGREPCEVSLVGPAHVTLSRGEIFRIDCEGPAAEDMRFSLTDERLAIAGGDDETVVHVILPGPRKLASAGSGRLECDVLIGDAEIAVTGSGRVEVARVEAERLKVSIAGSGRTMINGTAKLLELSIAGSGSCDAEGLTASRAAVHIAGSGDTIFCCDGEVSASMMGSGNVIVRGSAHCSVNSVGSGSVLCERAHATA